MPLGVIFPCAINFQFASYRMCVFFYNEEESKLNQEYK